MSKFSELLAEICRKRNITSELLSKLSGVERTQTYRLLKGTRKPSGAEQVRQISRALQLSFQEAEELDRALQIDTVGYKIYERREYLNKLFQDLSFLSLHQPRVSFLVDLNKEENYAESMTFIRGKQEIGNALRMISKKEGMNKNGEIDLFLNPDLGVVESSNILEMQEESTLKIRHLLLFDNGSEDVKDLVNLRNLFSLLPFLIKNRGYEPRVCYEKLDGIESRVVLFPYYCIAGDYVLEISSDGTDGRLIRNAACALYFRNKFISVYSRSTRMAIARHDLADIINFYTEFNSKSKDQMNYVLEAQAGLSRYVTSDDLVYNLETNRAEVRSAVDAYILLESSILQDQREQGDGKAGMILSFFTEEGMRLFLKEGRILQVPEGLLEPFLPQARVEIIERLITDAKSGRLLLRMIDEDKYKLPLFFSISSYASRIGMALYPSQAEYWTIEVEEVSAVFAVEDYLTYLSNSDLVFGQDESIRRLEKLMARSLDIADVR